MRRLLPLLFFPAFLGLVLSGFARADVKLPAIFSDHMVLQREAKAAFWGWASPGETVTVVPGWEAAPVTVKADERGKWKALVQTGKAGGPYQVTIRGKNQVVFQDVLLGEVWICSGQSNMDQTLSGYRGQPIQGGNEEIAAASTSGLRLFKVKRALSYDPQEDCQGEWKRADPASAAAFSATGWFFGKFLRKALGVPVGLVHTAWGGTKAEAWTSLEKLKTVKGVNLSPALSRKKIWANAPTAIFNAMVYPIIPYTVKGVVWYQGESNRREPGLYSRLFPAMIQDWRERWGKPEMPFFFCQIAPYSYGAPAAVGTALIREAQSKTMASVPGTGMAVLLDIGEEYCIHPRAKKVAGTRLAFWALAKAYGMDGIGYTAPIYKGIEIQKNGKVLVTFDHLGNGLLVRGGELQGFEVAGADKVFHPAKARLARWAQAVLVWSEEVKKPVAVRYCFHNWCVGTLFGVNELPVSSFRSDDWPEKP